VAVGTTKKFPLAVKNGELLAQGQVFQGQPGAIAEEGPEKDEKHPKDRHRRSPRAMLPEVLLRRAAVSGRTVANASKLGADGVFGRDRV